MYIGEDVEESAIAKPIVAVFEEKRGVGIFALYKAANKGCYSAPLRDFTLAIS